MMAVMVFVVSLEVVMRYVFASSLIFASELSRLLFVWVVFLGLALAAASGKEVAIRLLPDLLKAHFRSGLILALVTRSAGISLMLLLAVVNWEFVVANWHRPLNSMPGNAGLFHLPLTIGAVLTAFHLAVGAVEAMLSRAVESPAP
ncbi:TRAP transporter small permease [Oceanibacterium hippocampi]|nr:TRAP transporter small permease subunit [Oceanibacterium hippocampi]